MSQLEILIPVAVTRNEQHALAPRLSRLTGARIGWLDNRKANAGSLLREVVAEWRSAVHDFAMLWTEKNATLAAPEAVLAQLKTCHAVVLAIAD